MSRHTWSLRHSLIASSLCATGLLLVGCQNRPVGPGVAINDPIANEIYPNVTVEHVAQPYVAIPYDAVVVDQPDGTRPMRVSVPVRSTADQGFGVQYQFSWYDVDGRPQGESGWQFVWMEPGLQRQLAANALSQAVQDWRLEVRLSR